MAQYSVFRACFARPIYEILQRARARFCMKSLHEKIVRNPAGRIKTVKHRQTDM